MDYQNRSRNELIEDLQKLTREFDILKSAHSDLMPANGSVKSSPSENEDRWRFAIEATTDGVWDWDTTTGETFYSEPLKEMLGYSDSEMGNTLDAWRKLVHPEDLDGTLKRLNSHLQGETKLYSAEYRLLCKDETYKWILGEGKVVRYNEQGNPLRVVGTHKDINVRKFTEVKVEKLSRLNQVISHVNKAITHFRVKEQLIGEVCRIAVQYGKFDMAWIGLVNEQTMLIEPVFADGFDEGFLEKFKPISLNEDPTKRGPIGSAIREGFHFVFDDFLTDYQVGDWKEEAIKRGYRSSITLPLIQFGKIAGTFTLYSGTPSFFIPEEIRLLDDFVGEISFAFEAIETENERKKAEDQLQKLSLVVEQSPVSIIITDIHGNIEYANPTTSETTGYTTSELMGKNPRLFKSGETTNHEYQLLWENISLGKEWRGVFHNKRKNGELYWESSTINPIRDKNGLVTHYLEVKENITEQIKTQKALFESEERFRQIVEQSQTVIWEFDPDGLHTYVGPLSESVWGYTPEEIVGKLYFYDLHPPEGREEFKNTALEAIKRKEHFYNFESKIAMPDGTIKWISSNSIPILDDHDNLIGYRGADNDITARKLAEEEMLKFRTIADMATYGTAITSLEGIILYANAACSAIHGYEPGEISGRNLTIFHSQKQLPQVVELLEILNKNGSFAAVEVPHTRKDGSEFPTLMSASIIYDTNKIPQFYSATIIDISDLEYKKKALVDSEEALNQAQKLAKMGNWEHNLQTGKLTGSSNYYRLLGLDPDEKHDNLYEYFISLVHPDDLKIIDFLQQYTFIENELKVVEFRLEFPDGELKWVHQNILPHFENGLFAGITGIIIDITAKKRDEENIRQQNERMTAIIKAMPDLILVLDEDGNNLEFYTTNPDRLLVSEDQFKGTNVRMIFDNVTADLHLSKISECIKSQRIVAYEYSFIVDNKPSFFDARLAPLGKNKVLTFVRDITDRKTKDDAIKKLSLAVQQSPVSIVITDLNANIEYVNPAFESTTQYSSAEIIGKNVNILKSGKTDRAIYENLWNTINEGNNWQGEWINKKKNGALFWENISITAIHDELGVITNYLAVKQDITLNKLAEQEIRDLNTNLELKIEKRTNELATANLNLTREIEERYRIEEALMQSERSYRTVVENVNEVIFQTDAAGLWLFLNKSWEEVTGYTIEESLGQLFLNYVHPDDRQRNVELFEPLISREKDYCRHEVRYQTKDGGFRWVEYFARAGVNEQDEITGTFGTLLDITERKRAMDFENELLQLSPKLTGISQSEIDGALNLALSRIGHFLGADRSYIFEFNSDQTHINNTYEWCSDGISPEIDNLQQLPCDILPEWMKVIRRHENIIIPSVDDLPQSWQGEKDILQPQGIQSLVIIPILSEFNLIGFVGLDSVRNKRMYNAAEINNLKVWSSMLASLINDQRSERRLEQTRQNYETFFNTIDDFLFVLDTKGNIIHTNNTVNNRLEFTKEELFNQSILSVHPPERREETNRIVGEMIAGITEYCPVPIVTKSGRQIPVETRVKPGFWNGQEVIFGVSKDISQIELSEQKFSSAFHSNSALMAISAAKNGQFIDFNETFLAKLGYSREELIGKTSGELNLYADSKKRELIFSNLAQNIPVREVELEIRTKSGELMVGLFSADYIQIGEELCILAVMVDITERKQAIDELEQSRETHRGLSEAAFDSIFFSEKGICIEQNKMAEKVFGYTTEEALGRYGTDWIVPEDRKIVMDNMLAGIEEPYEVMALRKDGTTFPCMLSGKMMYYKGRNVRVTSLSDITDRKKAEEALLESEKRFSLFMDYLPALVFIKDFEGRMIYSNNAINKALGASEWLGKSLFDIFNAETASRIISDDKKTIQSGYQSIEESFLNLDGSLHHYETQKFVIPRSGQKSILGGISLDITERKKAEEEIIKSRNEAESANHAKSEFLSRMSHELRTPMNSILGFAQLLQMGELEFRQRKGVNHIIHSGKHLLDLINEVLDISRIEAGRISLALEPIQLNGVILEMIDSIQPQATARNITIKLIDSSLHNTCVIADNQRLKQVLMNLLSNSIKYDREGGLVIIEITTRPPNPLEQSLVRISISDTGIGIAAEDIPKLFTPFERIGAEKTETEGTGLGLTVVKKLMDAMDGEIGVESVPGEGSTFWIELPAGDNQHESVANPVNLTEPESALTHKNGTILYIEDNRSNIELVEQILASHRPNIRLVSIVNGKQAVSLALKVNPELILLDLDLPDINGDEVIALLQADATTKPIPVVIISADAMPLQQEKLLKAGARSYLTKPIDVLLFLLEVDKWLFTNSKGNNAE